jgi:hypothetical protein
MNEKTSSRPWLPALLTVLALAMILPLGALTLFGERWLVMAIKRGDAWTVRWLLRFNSEWARSKTLYELSEKKSSILGGGNQLSLLGMAVELEYSEIALILFQHGAQENDEYEHFDFCYFILKNPVILEKFIKSELNLKKYNLLLIAFKKYLKNEKQIEILLKTGIDVNALGHVAPPTLCVPTGRPLHLAGSKESILLLLQHGADPNLSDFLDETPIFRGNQINDNIEKIQILLQNGADPNYRNCNGESPLFGTKGAEATQLLLDAGADPNLPNNNGETPLFDAVRWYFHKGKIKALLKAGANPLWRNKQGCTIFDIMSQDN